MERDPYFDGRTAIVTGAASGIGRALSSALAVRGAHVVMADIDDVGVKSAADALSSASPGRTTPAVLDVTDSAAFAALVGQVAEEHGSIDLLFNNAGIGVGGPVREMSTAHFDRAIDVNLRGVIHGVVAAYPRMCDQGRGHIVNTASLAGLITAPLLTPYAATKHAVVGLSISLRAEAAAHGVRVSAVCPGVVDTPLLDTVGPDDLPATILSGQVREFFRHVQPRFYAADQLAQDIIRGIDRNAALVIAPASARVAYYLWRYAPGVVYRMNARQLARSRAAFPDRR